MNRWLLNQQSRGGGCQEHRTGRDHACPHVRVVLRPPGGFRWAPKLAKPYKRLGHRQNRHNEGVEDR